MLNFESLLDGLFCRLYRLWTKFILVWAVYSSFFTPLEFAFFRGLPRNLFLLDIAGQIAFLIDIVVKFFVAYRDPDTYRIVYDPTAIALRYFKSSFIFDLLGCFPWDVIYKVTLLLKKTSSSLVLHWCLCCNQIFDFLLWLVLSW